jgi:hypothetical protein
MLFDNHSLGNRTTTIMDDWIQVDTLTQIETWINSGQRKFKLRWETSIGYFENCSQRQYQSANAGETFVCRLSILPRNILSPPPSVLSSGRVFVTVLHYLTQVVPGLNIQCPSGTSHSHNIIYYSPPHLPTAPPPQKRKLPDGQFCTG